MRCVLLLCSLFAAWAATAQTAEAPFYRQKIAEFNRHIEQAPTDSAKIEALARLADYYFIYRAEKQADSVLQLQLQLAEISNNENLIRNTLFGEGLTNIESWASAESFDKATAFADKGLQFAREQNNKEYEAIARLRKAMLYRKRGRHDLALQQTALIFPLLNFIESDSLKAASYIELGDIFQARGNAVDAYTQYNSAYDIAYGIKNYQLQSAVYHRLSALYLGLHDEASARKSLNNSLALNLTNNNSKGLLLDYFNLARLTDNKEYINRLARLADSLQSEKYMLLSKRLMYGYMVVKEKNSAAVWQYLRTHPDLHQSILNTGSANYLFNIGSIYRYSGQPDSAIYYYAQAEPEMERRFDAAIRSIMNKEMGECYLMMGKLPQATAYFEQALQLGTAAGQLDSNAVLAVKLSRLYAQQGNYKQAFEYNQQYLNYKDTLDKLANDRSLVQLELEREASKHEKDLAELKRKEVRKHNLQYMGISLGIAAFFTILILMGMFRVSRMTVRILGFFAFICLFEFFIVMIDSYLHHATHGEPLKIWIAKIFIIALLLPLHHYLEHKVVHFLESQKLLKLRQRFSVKRLWNRKKIIMPADVAAPETPVVN
ncbi:MAG: tetratricopeptide repeat protein [Chitinophagaceae bacterium]